MNNLSELTIVIVTYKTNLDILKNCLNSINSKIRTLIIENSNFFDDKQEIQEQFSNVEILCTGSNLGYGAGNNFGLKQVKTKYALILNPDIICSNDFFSNITKYLEGNIIEKTRTINRFEVDNQQSSGAHLPEPATAEMNIFLSKIEQLLPVLGQDFLKPISKAEVTSENDILHCEIKKLRANGRQTENGFVVLEGSEAVLVERASTKKYPYPSILRKKLIAEDVLKESQERLVFEKDYEFSSPSAAASVIHGGHANGLTSWKDSNGISLKQAEEKEVSSS